MAQVSRRACIKAIERLYVDMQSLLDYLGELSCEDSRVLALTIISKGPDRWHVSSGRRHAMWLIWANIQVWQIGTYLSCGHERACLDESLLCRCMVPIHSYIIGS